MLEELNWNPGHLVGLSREFLLSRRPWMSKIGKMSLILENQSIIIIKSKDGREIEGQHSLS